MRYRSLIPTSLVGVVAVALLTAGCGGGSSTTAATTNATQNGPLAYAHCMRSHGVTNFPDPSASGGTSKQTIVSALKHVGNSQAQTAQTACMNVNGGSPGIQQSAAQNRARTGALLAFARCMRHRGLENFPDPSSTGQLSQEMLASAGVNLHQPGLRQAANACTSVTHGVITRAVVARFIAGQ